VSTLRSLAEFAANVEMYTIRIPQAKPGVTVPFRQLQTPGRSSIS
jgi:hypothetical protein